MLGLTGFVLYQSHRVTARRRGHVSGAFGGLVSRQSDDSAQAEVRSLPLSVSLPLLPPPPPPFFSPLPPLSFLFFLLPFFPSLLFPSSPSPFILELEVPVRSAALS